MTQYSFLDENWEVQPRYALSDEHMETCPVHGEFCPNAYYSQLEVSGMIAAGQIECPLCLAEIAGVS